MEGETQLVTLLHIIRRSGARIETILAEQQRVIVGLKSYGGKVEDGQSILENMVTEAREEGGITVFQECIIPYITVDFYNLKNGDRSIPRHPSVRMVCGVTEIFEGAPQDSEEMKNPKWYDSKTLPFQQMIMGDHLFIPQLLNREYRKGWMIRRFEKDHRGNIHFTKLLGACFWGYTPKTL